VYSLFYNIHIKKCNYNDIKEHIQDYYKSNNNIIVDSFWETHVRESNFYKIEDGENMKQ